MLPFNNADDRTVAAVEFRPGNRKIVHHAIFYLDNTGIARKKDEEDPGLGYTSFGGPGFIPSGGLGGWAPGVTPHLLPDGLAKFVKSNSDLVMQIHYHPNGKAETDQSSLGIYFSKKPPARIVTGIALLNLQSAIPPGEHHYRITNSVTLPTDVVALGVAPHMHLLGREMKITATLPDGKIQPLVWIKDWDFNWQDQYAFAKPLSLPKGTVLDLEAIYDNSAENPSESQ